MTADLAEDVRTLIDCAGLKDTVTATATTKGLFVANAEFPDWPQLHIKPAINHRVDNTLTLEEGEYQELLCAVLMRVWARNPKTSIATDTPAGATAWEQAADLYRIAFNEDPQVVLKRS